MTLTAWDHVLVAFLLLVVPLYGRFSSGALARKLAAGDPRARRVEYQWTIALEWGLAAIVILLWALAGRSAAALGFALPPGWRTVGGAVATAVGLALLAAQWRMIVRLDERALEGIRAQLAGAADLIPRTDAEHGWFRAVALTAGIVEEIVYRGYLVAYCAVFVGSWVGALVAAVAFGLGHVYQGPMGIVKTGVAGLVAGVLYVATGSLLWSVILHAAVDWQGGALGRRALR